ncbi:MAG: endonuclease/exonuclease/phosphatase family protein [Prevotellaceae bacterium]|nr:endonuclease/exonuclease/phosphatase family protein [Candidatus Colivivens equi]
MNFLYWNIHKRASFFDAIVEMVCENEVDILMLAEFHEKKLELVLEAQLQARIPNYHIVPQIQSNKVVIFSCLKNNTIADIYDSSRLTIKKLYSSVLDESINLAICHFYDAHNATAENQSEYAQDVREQIETIEKKDSCSKTILCGDLNMNPFDEGVVKARGFNAVMDKGIARNEYREVNGNRFMFFYNPMWGFLGDTGKGDVCGTYYYNPSQPIQYYWHVLDQVLVRPSLLDFFDTNKLRIVTKTTKYNFITKQGLIDAKNYSDHLPILFNLNI